MICHPKKEKHLELLGDAQGWHLDSHPEFSMFFPLSPSSMVQWKISILEREILLLEIHPSFSLNHNDGMKGYG